MERNLDTRPTRSHGCSLLMLARYTYLVKNLRGVYIASSRDDIGEHVSWLSRKFRYRDLGVPSCLVEGREKVFEGKLSGNPFHQIDFPTQHVKEAALEVVEALNSVGVDKCTAFALTLASSYASPLLATSSVVEELVESGVVIHVVEGPKLDDKSAKLHLRIVDYTVLDAYLPSIEEARRLALNREKLLESRKAFAERDSKRYWRFAGKGDNKVIVYLDYLHLLPKKLLEKLVSSPELEILLPLLAAFNLDAVER